MPKKSKNKLIEIIFIIILFIASSFILLFPLEASHYWDESIYLQHAEIFSSGKNNYSELYYRPPFLSLAISFGYLFWHNLYMAQIVTTLINVLGIVCLYFLGKRLFNWQTGAIASILLMLSPFCIIWSHFVLTDMPSLSFMIILRIFDK